MGQIEIEEKDLAALVFLWKNAQTSFQAMGYLTTDDNLRSFQSLKSRCAQMLMEVIKAEKDLGKISKIIRDLSFIKIRGIKEHRLHSELMNLFENLSELAGYTLGVSAKASLKRISGLWGDVSGTIHKIPRELGILEKVLKEADKIRLLGNL